MRFSRSLHEHQPFILSEVCVKKPAVLLKCDSTADERADSIWAATWKFGTLVLKFADEVVLPFVREPAVLFGNGYMPTSRSSEYKTYPKFYQSPSKKLRRET